MLVWIGCLIIIKEYHVIYQDVLPDTKIKDIDKLTIAISEGPSPYKEIVLPNMVGWDTSQVLEFVEDNYLSNVYVEFVQGTVNENTLIEQSKSGNVKRNDEIKLVFSYGEERHYTEVKMGDLFRSQSIKEREIMEELFQEFQESKKTL